MANFFLRRTAPLAWLAFAGAAPWVQAQNNTATTTLAPVTVTGNPLKANDLIAPATSLSGDNLLQRAKTTLGETLDGTPGVSSTYFGPNASRPVIRGLDGDRIRILANGGAALDASNLSYDHAVTLDPLSIERVEVLRGPGALLYGGTAVGGVVNIIDNRIAREPQFDAAGGVSGKVDLNLATGNAERGKGLLLETGTERYNLHVDAFNRRTGDVRAPADLLCDKTGANVTQRRICNSASQVGGGAVGGSLFFDKGYLGASTSTYRSTYGTVAEPDVTIGMKSDRHALEGEIRQLGGWLQSVKFQAQHTDYAHTEYDLGQAGTLFKNRGSELRLEARQQRRGALDGMVGLQLERNRFSADGEEVFAPYSQTRQAAAFTHQELTTAWGKLSAGARMESVRVNSLGNPDLARFVVGQRDFKPVSAALGALWRVAPAWQVTSNLAYTERAPKDYELYADGPHVATHAYEKGNAALQKEKSTSLDLGAAWQAGPRQFKLNAYVNQFSNYIGLNARPGQQVDDLPLFEYEQVRARLVGAEASGKLRLKEGASTVDLLLRGDVVRASDQTNGQPLPRIAPWRAGASLEWGSGPWKASLGADHVAAQNRVPAPPAGTTSAYNLWNAAAFYRVKSGPVNWRLFARLDNITDQLAYSATSILTTTAYPRAPLPGRSLKLGLQASF